MEFTENWRGTTIVCVRKGDELVMACDGQITLGNQIIFKSTANKIRTIVVKGKRHNEDLKVLVGFAGSTADGLTLYENLEEQLKDSLDLYDLEHIVVELSRKWRSENFAKRQAMMIIADKKETFIVDGIGNAIKPEEYNFQDTDTVKQICTIGSGGQFALAAGRVLLEFTDLSAEEIARTSLKVAGEICPFTNQNIRVETLS